MSDRKICNYNDAEDYEAEARYSREDRLCVAVLLVVGILSVAYVAAAWADGMGWLS